MKKKLLTLILMASVLMANNSVLEDNVKTKHIQGHEKDNVNADYKEFGDSVSDSKNVHKRSKAQSSTQHVCLPASCWHEE